jgi:hypothetical protein
MNLLRAWSTRRLEDVNLPSRAPEDEDAFIERIANHVVRRRLEAPAVLFLEMHRPISFIASQGLFFCAPFLGLFVSPEGIERFARLLDTPQGVDRLIERIEEHSRKR